MYPDSPTPPNEEARGDRASSRTPAGTTWHRLDEDLPKWDSWSTLAGGASSPAESIDGRDNLEKGTSPSRRPPGIKAFRLSDVPSADDLSNDDVRQRATDERGRSAAQPSVELYDHRPLFSPQTSRPGSAAPTPSRDGVGSSGDGARYSGDGHRSSDERYASPDHTQARGDGYQATSRAGGDDHKPHVQSGGDGYARGTLADGNGFEPRTQSRGDNYGKPTQLRGDGSGRAAGEGDGHTNSHGDGVKPSSLRGDGHQSPAVQRDAPQQPPIQGDGYQDPALRGDGIDSLADHGDGYEKRPTHGEGFRNLPTESYDFESPGIRGDGFGSPAIEGDGYDKAQRDGYDKAQRDGYDKAQGDGYDKIRGDGYDKVHGDGFDGGVIQGDGYDEPLANGAGHTPEAEESLEPWNDLSEFSQIESPTAASAAGQEADSDEGFSALDLRDRVVIMLLFKQVVQIDAVEKAHRRWQKESGGKSKEPLWRVLTMDPAFDREKIFAEAAQVYAFKQATLEKKVAAAFIKKHKDTFAETFWDRMTKLRVLPIRQETQSQKKEKRIIFVSHDPSRPDVNRLMRELKLDSFELQYAPEAEIEALIDEAFPKRNEYLDRVSDGEFAFDLGTSYDQSSTLIDEDALEAEISRSSLINLFEAALVEAVRRGVSDIHIFPNPRKQIEIHFRVDGELECWHREERVHPEAFLAVVKDNTLNVDRFERDTAQDGFIQRKVDDTLIRYRVSVLPVANANQEIRSESIVIRVLDDRKVITDLGRLGLLDQARAKFEWAIRQPHGMVILTGPTGSGKTTTLFAAMHQVVTQKVNVLTVEDPVEYVIPGVRQIKLSHKLSLEQALRSILRHDPDIVMVGEMRDRDTAELAIKLANTGHLTFSTLHTNDAPSAVSRLYKMGVEPFLIAYAINLVVAQRLLRTLCAKCKRPVKNLDHAMLLRLGFTPQELAHARFYDEGHNPDCRACGGVGYKGRRAITETMAFSDAIRRTIVMSNEMIDEDGLRQQAIADGMLTLRGSAREIVKQGDTSVTELIRVTAGEH